MPALPWLAPGPPARWLSEPEGKEHGLPTCQSQVLFLRSVQRVTLQCAAAAAPQKAHRQPGLEDSEPDWKRDIDSRPVPILAVSCEEDPGGGRSQCQRSGPPGRAAEVTPGAGFRRRAWPWAATAAPSPDCPGPSGRGQPRLRWAFTSKLGHVTLPFFSSHAIPTCDSHWHSLPRSESCVPGNLSRDPLFGFFCTQAANFKFYPSSS